MDTLFDFGDQTQEEQGLKDWSGNVIPVSDNPMVRLHGAVEGKKCKDCKHLTKEYYRSTSYIKCDLRKHTRGPGSDHRVKWQACKKFEQEEPEVKEGPVKQPNQPFTEVCPQCKGSIKVLYKHGVWCCSACKIKIAQTQEAGITRIEPLMTFSISPLEIPK